MKKQVCIAVFWALVACATVSANEIPKHILQAIEARFPGAQIVEVEEETWQGHQVMEVDLVADDGSEYEVLVSPTGEILDVSEDSESGNVPVIGGELSFGAAIRTERDIYRHIGTETEFTPFVLYQNGPLEILNFDNLGAVIRFYRGKQFSMGASFKMAPGEGFAVKDHAFYKGMDEPSTMFSAGVEFGFEIGDWEASLEGLGDIRGKYNGYEISSSLMWQKELYGFSIQPEISFTWLSRKTIDYLYGVSIKEAKENRPAYSPGASYEADVSLLLLRPISRKFTAVGLVGATILGNDIRNSPLVDKKNEFAVSLGLMFSL